MKRNLPKRTAKPQAHIADGYKRKSPRNEEWGPPGYKKKKKFITGNISETAIKIIYTKNDTLQYWIH